MKKAFAVVAVCFCLNLISPFVVSQQRTLSDATFSWQFGPHTRTLEVRDGMARVLIDAQVTDQFPINPATRFPAEQGRAGLGPLLPYEPQRRTYPMWWEGEEVPLDYVGSGSVQGLQTYKYSATLPGGCVRDVDVERRTGRILDEIWSCEGQQWVLGEASRSEGIAAAKKDMRVLVALQVMAVLTRLIGAAAFVVGLVAYARR